jgi:hypothetical protein
VGGMVTGSRAVILVIYNVLAASVRRMRKIRIILLRK